MPPGFGYISATLKAATAAMTPPVREAAYECFQHYQREFEHIAPEAPDSVAYSVHLLLDEKVQHLLSTSQHAPDIQCRKGCAACCHIQVDVFTQEADLLLQLAREDGIDIDWARLERQAGKTDATWRELPVEDQRCVFLDEQRHCRVYEHRPGTCRKYMVKSDPDLCDMNKHPGGKVAIVFDHEAEIVHSAAMTVFGAANMATMLLQQRNAAA